MSRELEIVGFNGNPVARVGLCTPIAFDRGDSADPWMRFKVGTRSLDQISVAAFDEYEREGRLTRLPRSETIICPDESYIPDFKIVVGYAKEDLLRDINKVKVELGSSAGFNFDWQHSPGRYVSVLVDSSVPLHVRTLRLLREEPRLWYWVGETQREVNMLNVWSEALCKRFDIEWLRNFEQLQQVKNDPEKLKDELQYFEEIAWNAAVCASYSRPSCLQAYLRLFTCFTERDPSEEFTRRRFEQGAILVLPDITWESFKSDLEEYRRRYAS